MGLHHALHRIFLVFMFVVCAVATITLMENRADAANVSTDNSSQQTTTGINIPACGIANGKSFSKLPDAASGQLCASSIAKTIKVIPDGWIWNCGDANSSFNVTCAAKKNSAAASSVSDNKQASGAQTQSTQQDQQLHSLQPITISARDLGENKNPKTAGATNALLQIGDISMIANTDGSRTIFLTGKAEPETWIKVFIFSTDPLVISVKTDVNGDWGYELSKEIADGTHEMYVAETDADGVIISKSEPIAFVKTAQAVSVIPVSELDQNASPVERSRQQYIVVAIVIISVFSVVALILVGILTYKCKTNEEIS